MVILLSIIGFVFGILQIVLFFKLWGMTNDIRIMKQNMQGVEHSFGTYMLLDEKEKAFSYVKFKLLEALYAIKNEYNYKSKDAFVKRASWTIGKYNQMANATGFKMPEHLQNADAFWEYYDKVEKSQIYREQ